MRTLVTILVVALAALPSGMMAQYPNPRPISNGPRNSLTASVGADNGTWYGLSYERSGARLVVPIAYGWGVRVPFGRELVDDWQLALGARAEAFRSGAVSLDVGYRLLVQRLESPMARFYDLGTGAGVTLGASGARWSAAATATYDWSGLTHARHKLSRDYYPDIQDGWYDAEGGAFRFGAAAGYAAGSWGVTLAAGRIFGKNFEDDPTVPYFLELAVQRGW